MRRDTEGQECNPVGRPRGQPRCSGRIEYGLSKERKWGNQAEREELNWRMAVPQAAQGSWLLTIAADLGGS